MNKKFTLFFIMCLAIWISACKKQAETPVENVKTGGSTVPDPLVVDTAKLITGWWQPENYLVQNKLYFGADKFFYIDSLNQKAPYAGTWSLENNIIRCKSTVGGHLFKFEIVSVNASKLYLKTTGVGVLEPFNKTAEPPITSPKLLSIAGTGVKGYSGDGGPASAAGVDDVAGMATDKLGNIYFCDGLARIRKINAADGKISTVAGTGIWGNGNRPDNVPALTTNISAYRLAIDDAGNIYYANGYEIYKITKSDGLITHIAGGGNKNTEGIPAKKASIGFITGIAVSPNGDVYVADRDNRRIRKISGGIINTILPMATAPNAIAIDNDNNIYFTETIYLKKLVNGVKPAIIVAGKAYTGNNYVAGDGSLATKAMFRSAYAVTVSAKGDIFVSDGLESTVRKIDATTKIITRVAGNGFLGSVSEGLHATAYPLYVAEALTTDVAGNNLYIGSLGFRIHKVQVSQ